jgi:hypothetical protein
MAIPDKTREEMKKLLDNGKTYAQIHQKYPEYGYWGILSEVGQKSIFGKKKMITSRLNKLKAARTQEERAEIVEEAKGLLNELYDQLKTNSKKLADIETLIRGT